VPFAETIVGFFIPDASTISIAAGPLRIIGLFMWIEAFGMIVSFSLIGAGATKIVMINSLVIQWCLSLPLNWFWGVYLGYGLFGMFLNGFFMVVLRTSIFAFIWHKERWNRIKI
ncbi:MAG: MATE family efflux transporter, partial [bacterium]